jgi:hypothetical protein
VVLPEEEQHVLRGETREGRATEVRVIRNIVFFRHVQIRKIASASSGNEHLRADPIGMVKHQHGPAPFPAFPRTKKPGSTSADNNHIFFNGIRH